MTRPEFLPFMAAVESYETSNAGDSAVGSGPSKSAAWPKWLFALTGLPLLAVAMVARGRRFVALARPVALRALAAGALAAMAFWIVIWALTQAPMGLVAAARETSVVFVALAGGWVLKERVNWLAIGAVFAGVVLIRIAGA